MPLAESDDQELDWKRCLELFLQEQYGEATECFEDLAVNAWFWAARSLQEQQEYKKSIELFDLCLKRSPKDPMILGNIGISYEALGQQEKAYTYFQRAVKLDSRDLYLRRRLGISYREMGKYKKSIKCFEDPLDVESNRAQKALIPPIPSLSKPVWLHILSLIRDFEFQLFYDAITHEEAYQEWQKQPDSNPPEIGGLLGDTLFHDYCADELWKVLQHLPTLSKSDLLDLINSPWWMLPKSRQKQVRRAVESDFSRVKKSLGYLLNESIDLKARYDALLRPKNPLHIPGFSPYQASQLLAALNKKTHMVFEDSVVRGMQDLGLIENSLSRAPRKGQQYLYLNDICNGLCANSSINLT